MKKYIYLLFLMVFAASCSEKPFEGKISYEIEFESGLGKKFGLLDNIVGQVANSTMDLYVKDGKVMIITEPNNQFFGAFQFEGAFTKLIWDLDTQEAFIVNDKDKTYMRESLLESDIEGFSFKDMKAQIDSAMLGIGTSTGEMTIAQYPCKTYDIDGRFMKGKVALNPDLLLAMAPTVSKIEGMQDYDWSTTGFPLYFESKLMGAIGYNCRASKVEKKELSNDIFSLDGYRKIDQLEFYQTNFESLPLEELGLSEGVEALKGKADSLMNGLSEGIGAEVDSLVQKLDVGGILDGFNDFLKGDSDDEK